jgi:RNA polymerase sigma-70 factor (ECF subfamily)
MTVNDAELLSGLRNSDKNSYEALFRRYYASLYRQIWCRCHDRHLAEDIVQDAFVRVWMKRTGLMPTLTVFPFLLTIAVNLLRDHHKHSVVALRHEESVRLTARDRGDEPDVLLSESLLHDRIMLIANKHLSEKCRSIFILSRIEGRSNAEIAEVLGVSTKMVENHLYHALKILRKKLSAYK